MCGMNLRAISQEFLMNFNRNMCFEITLKKLLQHISDLGGHWVDILFLQTTFPTIAHFHAMFL